MAAKKKTAGRSKVKTKATPKKRGRGRPSPTGRKWPPEWQALIDKTPEQTLEAFAKSVGVNKYTLWRIAVDGDPPGDKTRERVYVWAKERGLDSPLEPPVDFLENLLRLQVTLGRSPR